MPWHALVLAAFVMLANTTCRSSDVQSRIVVWFDSERGTLEQDHAVFLVADVESVDFQRAPVGYVRTTSIVKRLFSGATSDDIRQAILSVPDIDERGSHVLVRTRRIGA